jgi:hypothetical protein
MTGARGRAIGDTAMNLLKAAIRKAAWAFSVASILFVSGVWATIGYPDSDNPLVNIQSVVVKFLSASNRAQVVSPASPLPVSMDAVATGGYLYAHIAAGSAATYIIKAAPGTLHTICYNGPATATDVTTVYDNASGSGNVIAIPLLTGVTVPSCQTFDIAFVLGLTIITAAANGSDLTVSYE